jgi:hypothetical protein
MDENKGKRKVPGRGDAWIRAGSSSYEHVFPLGEGSVRDRVVTDNAIQRRIPAIARISNKPITPNITSNPAPVDPELNSKQENFSAKLKKTHIKDVLTHIVTANSNPHSNRNPLRKSAREPDIKPHSGRYESRSQEDNSFRSAVEPRSIENRYALLPKIDRAQHKSLDLGAGNRQELSPLVPGKDLDKNGHPRIDFESRKGSKRDQNLKYPFYLRPAAGKPSSSLNRADRNKSHEQKPKQVEPALEPLPDYHRAPIAPQPAPQQLQSTTPQQKPSQPPRQPPSHQGAPPIPPINPVDINLDMPEDYNTAPPSVDKGHKIVAPVVPRSIANPYLHNGPSSTYNLTVDVLVQIVKPLMKIDKLDLRIKRGAVLPRIISPLAKEIVRRGLGKQNEARTALLAALTQNEEMIAVVQSLTPYPSSPPSRAAVVTILSSICKRIERKIDRQIEV